MLQEFEFAGRVMGCDVHVSLVMQNTDALLAEVYYKEILNTLQSYEQTFSRFLPESELSLVNAYAGKGEMHLSERFARIVREALALSEQTDGLFNPLLQVTRLGYDKSLEKLVDSHEALEEYESYNTDCSTVTVKDSHGKYVITLQAGQQLDVAGMLKGYCAQRLAYKYADKCTGIIVNIGGDISAYGTDAHGEVFVMRVYNPLTKQDTGEFMLGDGKTLATSGNYKRVWRRRGKKYSHIVASTTKQNPNTDLVSASVLADDGAQADAFATVAMTLTSKHAQTFLMQHGVHFMLLTKAGDSIIG